MSKLAVSTLAALSLSGGCTDTVIAVVQLAVKKLREHNITDGGRNAENGAEGCH